MNIKEIVTGYFTFTRKERIGLLIFLSLALLIFLMPSLFNAKNTTGHATTDTTWVNAMKLLEHKDITDKDNNYGEYAATSYQFDPSKGSSYKKPGETLFYFDPNMLDKEGWQTLGLRDKTIQTILNYRNKGGLFKRTEDLQRIYGFAKQDYERLAPYVRIQNVHAPKEYENYTSKSSSYKDDIRPNNFVKSPLNLDINTADTTAFIALPGIGSKLAARIVNFRDKLGGFYSIDQVGETFGLPDSTFQKIRTYLQLKNNSIRKININTATVDELKAHPYIKYSIANPIVAYRTQHGPFSKHEDIKKVMVVTDEVYNKISPYLTTQ